MRQCEEEQAKGDSNEVRVLTGVMLWCPRDGGL